MTGLHIFLIVLIVIVIVYNFATKISSSEKYHTKDFKRSCEIASITIGVVGVGIILALIVLD